MEIEKLRPHSAHLTHMLFCVTTVFSTDEHPFSTTWGINIFFCVINVENEFRHVV